MGRASGDSVSQAKNYKGSETLSEQVVDFLLLLLTTHRLNHHRTGQVRLGTIASRPHHWTFALSARLEDHVSVI